MNSLIVESLVIDLRVENASVRCNCASETLNQGLGLIYCIGHFDQASMLKS